MNAQWKRDRDHDELRKATKETLILTAFRSMRTGYATLNWFASGEDRKAKIGGADAHEVMAQAYAEFAPAYQCITRLMGMSTKADTLDAISRVEEFVVTDIKVQRAKLKHDQKQFAAQKAAFTREKNSLGKATLAYLQQKDREFEARVEAEVERRYRMNGVTPDTHRRPFQL